MKNAEEKKAELKEIKEKIETYVNQQLEDYISKKKEKKSKPKEPLFDLVLAIDKEIDLEFFKTDGADLFTPLFKNTLYGQDVMYSVCNNDTLDRDDMMFTPCEFETPDAVEKKLSKIDNLDAKINYVINNIMMKIMATYEDK